MYGQATVSLKIYFKPVTMCSCFLLFYTLTRLCFACGQICMDRWLYITTYMQWHTAHFSYHKKIKLLKAAGKLTLSYIHYLQALLGVIITLGNLVLVDVQIILINHFKAQKHYYQYILRQYRYSTDLSYHWSLRIHSFKDFSFLVQVFRIFGIFKILICPISIACFVLREFVTYNNYIMKRIIVFCVEKNKNMLIIKRKIWWKHIH